MVPRSILIVKILALILFISRTSAELFTAISDVEHLLETHKKIVDNLDVYITKEEKRLINLKKHLKLYKMEHERAMEDIPNYLGNPINAFTLIKRLTSDLDNIEKGIKIGTEYIKNITMSHTDVKYPNNEDLTGAAQALTRLQTTYHLDVRDLSEGRLNGVIYSTPMTTSDCYELGRALYSLKDYRSALAWMSETLRKYREGDDDYLFNEIDIIEYISFSHYLLDDVELALKWTKQLLALDPTHDRALGNVPHYEKSIAERREQLKRKQRGEAFDYSADKIIQLNTNNNKMMHHHNSPDGLNLQTSTLNTGLSIDFQNSGRNGQYSPPTLEETEEEDEDSKKPSSYLQERSVYETLCRGEMDIPTEIAMRLTCRYHTDNPFLKLAPMKMEQMYIKPDIFVFYDVMSDEEIEEIKEMARPRFKRAVVHDPTTGDLVPANYRISKSSWLKDEEHPVVARVTRRVADITGLDMTSAEELQVVNYGIGGHYEPHYDFARKRENAFANFPGNRIATVLFYMSEVSQGGATVFTELGLSLSPVKRAAAYWLNLHPSGEGDLATRHAACPVLRGSKWVSNKWIHQGGQELIKPCSTQYQEEGYVRTIPKPIAKTSR